MKNRVRRRVLLDQKVQWSLAGRSFLLWIYHSLMLLAFLGLFQVLFGGIVRPWHEHWQAIWPAVLSVFVSMLVLLPFFLYSSFKLSHRFVGPVLRVRQALRDLAAGKPFEPVELRGSDYWPELAEELNAAVAVLSESRNKPEDESKSQESETAPEVVSETDHPAVDEDAKDVSVLSST